MDLFLRFSFIEDDSSVTCSIYQNLWERIFCLAHAVPSQLAFHRMGAELNIGKSMKTQILGFHNREERFSYF